MVERDHPAAADLAEQARVDAVLGLTAAFEAVAADELGGVGREQFDVQIPEMEAAAAGGVAAIIADVVIERRLPAGLHPALRDEDHVGLLEGGHVAGKVAAVPGALHAGDDAANRGFLRGGVHARRRWTGRRGGGEEEQEGRHGVSLGHLTASGEGLSAVSAFSVRYTPADARRTVEPAGVAARLN